jgi:hypothetical protein
MDKRVKITEEENSRVENLYLRFTGYCNILGYLAKEGSLDTPIFDKKWEEAIKINYELEQVKRQVGDKYMPEGEYSNYVFDFLHSELIYT